MFVNQTSQRLGQRGVKSACIASHKQLQEVVVSGSGTLTMELA